MTIHIVLNHFLRCLSSLRIYRKKFTCYLGFVYTYIFLSIVIVCVIVFGISRTLALIESDGEVSLERPSIDAVHIIRRALVHSRVHLSSRIDLEFRFHFIRADLPFVYLQRMEYR